MPESNQNVLSLVGMQPYQAAPDEEYMEPAQRAHFTRLLQAWKQQLIREAAQTGDSRANATQVEQIDSALQQIEEQAYGWCDSCGAEVGLRRLEARPTTKACIDCRTADEIKERQVGI